MIKISRQIIYIQITISIIILVLSCNNINKSHNQNDQIYEEIKFIDKKIDTILYKFGIDYAISALKPSVYQEDIRLFYNQYRFIVPRTTKLDTVNLRIKQNIDKLDLLQNLIVDLNVNDDTKKYFQDLYVKIKTGEIDNDRSLLMIKRFELTLVIDLFISQSNYKSLYDK